MNIDLFIAKLDTAIFNVWKKKNTKGIPVYPKPVNDLLNISYPMLPDKDIMIFIFDIIGKIIFQTTSSEAQSSVVNTKEFA